jgi:hypothetical protein
MCDRPMSNLHRTRRIKNPLISGWNANRDEMVEFEVSNTKLSNQRVNSDGVGPCLLAHVVCRQIL